MHKQLFFLLALPALLLWCLPEPALASDIFDIDKTPWGMTRQQTAKVLKIKLPTSVPADGGMTVSGFELDGFDGNMGYVFFNDKLIEINFSISANKQRNFTENAATKLQKRLERQFTKNYGKPQINNQQCDNIEDCHYSLWHKSPTTAVGLFYVSNKEIRNLGISYMQRQKGTSESPFYQPHEGLVIIPPQEDIPQSTLFK